MTGSRRAFTPDEAARFAEAGAKVVDYPPRPWLKIHEGWPRREYPLDEIRRIAPIDTDTPVTATEIEWHRNNPPPLTPEQQARIDSAQESILQPMIDRVMRTLSRHLTPPAFGKPDAALAMLVRDSIIKATPATVIPWRPGQGRLRLVLQRHHLPTTIDDHTATHTHRRITWNPSHD